LRCCQSAKMAEVSYYPPSRYEVILDHPPGKTVCNATL
jgi:hypothetical protein